ncbi:MAG: FAD-dependent oxidoreductase [Nitrososphaerales archaeon]
MANRTVKLNIDGKTVVVESGKTILEAALANGIYIPHLCYHPALTPSGACRLCLVEVEGMRGVVTSCSTPASDGMIVHTETPLISKLRKSTLEFILSEHPLDCLVCPKNLRCELQAVAQYIGVDGLNIQRRAKEVQINDKNPLIVIDPNKCILCGRCVSICNEVRKVGALTFVNRGKETRIGTFFNSPLTEAGCRFCGACVEVCPTAALMDKNSSWRTLAEREAKLVPCIDACPAHIDIPRYLAFIARGLFQEAVNVIREKAPFPRVLGRVCTHPCEYACKRGEVNEPIAIRLCKRFVADLDDKSWRLKIKKMPKTGKKVAIVGSGPAGLTAAYFLAKLGHSVVIFEAENKIGGLMRYGIPEFRLPKRVLDDEIEEIMNVGVDVRCNLKVESLESLFEQGFDAVFLSIGAGSTSRLGIQGEDLQGVVDCLSLLKAANLGQKIEVGRRVLVIGGGNSAIDAARTALRLGAESVKIIYRRSRVEMPAGREELDEALEEGVELIELTAPLKIVKENGVLRLTCIKMRLGDPDATGRRKPEPIEHSEFVIDADTIVKAVGQKPSLPSGFNLELDSNGRVKVDQNLMTSRKGVFAGGDIVRGPSSIIQAIADGRQAASAIDIYLGGGGKIDDELASKLTPNPVLGYDADFPFIKRVECSKLEPKTRIKSFDEVESGFKQEEAVREASRCLRCKLRLTIPQPILPPIETKYRLMEKG